MYFPQKWPSIGRLDTLLAKTLYTTIYNIIHVIYCLYLHSPGCYHGGKVYLFGETRRGKSPCEEWYVYMLPSTGEIVSLHFSLFISLFNAD